MVPFLPETDIKIETPNILSVNSSNVIINVHIVKDRNRQAP